jgi:hypothetical protein
VNEGQLLQVTATATDPDPSTNVLTFSLQGATNGASINPTTGVFSWTPSESQGPGPVSFTVRVTDGAGGLDEETISVTVNEVNLPPVLGAIGNKTGVVGTPVTFTATATDPDIPANTLTFSLDAGAPTGASINPTTGVFSFTPTTAGDFQVTVRSLTRTRTRLSGGSVRW